MNTTTEPDLTADPERLLDLVRQMRAELHDDELITNEEYAWLAQVEGSVTRLEGYDALRAENARLREAATYSDAEVERLASEKVDLSRIRKAAQETLRLMQRQFIPEASSHVTAHEAANLMAPLRRALTPQDS